MMTFLERRSLRKLVKHMRHEVRHARHMRGDLATKEQLDALREAEFHLEEAWAARSRERVEAAADELADHIRAVYPLRRHAKYRENLEILVVAVAVAMAFRTYFIQPFKIPTGSMQPTLYGITVEPQEGRGIMDHFPLNIVTLALFGERYIQVKAPLSGQIVRTGDTENDDLFEVQGNGKRAVQKIRKGLALRFSSGEFVTKGQLLAAGRIRRGDHIFVDKIRYNFSRPKRGNIFVFSTDQIDYATIRPNAFYIKRLAGLPNERISIQPPYLMANGQAVLKPYPFKRILEHPDYSHGYVLASRTPNGAKLDRPDKYFDIPGGEYLPLGDNTRHSLDGRYFGSVQQESVVGPAFMVYWPLGERWGHVR